MQLDAQTMAQARLAVRRAVAYHFADPNITLIEFGLKERGGQIIAEETAIRLHVRRKLSGEALESAVDLGLTRPIPDTIDGFQTDVSQGVYHPSWRGWWWRAPVTNTRTARLDPMRGGSSISDERHYAYGTLGGLVIDRQTGAEMILSNWHVLAADWSARPGQRLYQPGRLDGGTSADTVATLTRDAMAANLDAAVATLTGDRRLINDQIDLGPIRGAGLAELGMAVVKSGRRTGLTQGQVRGVEGVAKIRYGHIDKLIRRVVRIEPNWPGSEVSAPGDSGSIWLEQESRQAVGLHFAGSNLPERALAVDLLSVLQALDVELVTGVPVMTRPQVLARRRPATIGA